MHGRDVLCVWQGESGMIGKELQSKFNGQDRPLWDDWHLRKEEC